MPTLEEVFKRAGVNPFIFMYLPTIQRLIDAAIALALEKRNATQS